MLVSFLVLGRLASDALFHFPHLPAGHQWSSCTSSKPPVSVDRSHFSKLCISFMLGTGKGSVLEILRIFFQVQIVLDIF